MKSDTPETDAAIKASDGQWSYVLADCSRKLERERDEARAMLRRIARKGEFMDMEGQRLVVSDWLARRHISSENTPDHGRQSRASDSSEI